MAIGFRKERRYMILLKIKNSKCLGWQKLQNKIQNVSVFFNTGYLRLKRFEMYEHPVYLEFFLSLKKKSEFSGENDCLIFIVILTFFYSYRLLFSSS